MKANLLKKVVLFSLLSMTLIGCNKEPQHYGWMVKDGAPNEEIKVDEGQMYLDTATYDLYQYSNGSWIKVGNIKGADGKDGNDGQNGIDGTDGQNGKTPTIEIIGGYWHVDGKNTNVKAKGEDGQNAKAPSITIVDGYWQIDGVNTNVKAQGEDAIYNPSLSLNTEGYWVLNGQTTDVNIFHGGAVSVEEFLKQPITFGSFPAGMTSNQTRARISFQFTTSKDAVVKFIGDDTLYKWAVVEAIDLDNHASGTYLDSGWSNTWANYDKTFTTSADDRYIVLTIARINNAALTLDEIEKMHSMFEVSAYKYNEFSINSSTSSVSKNYNVKAVNHRGYSTEAPENTLAAYKLSAEKGFTYVECDISFTADNIPVLLHDSTIDRTSDGTGSITAMTYDAVSKYDFGSWKNVKYAGEKIPKFEEFVLLCRNLGLHPYIEIKGSLTLNQAQTLVEIVTRYGMIDKVSWISFNSNALYNVVSVDPTARVGFVVDGITSQTIATVVNSLRTGSNEVFIDCNFNKATQDSIDLCIAQLIPLEVYTVNNENDIINLNPYISGVTSDFLIAGEVLEKASK